MYRLCDKYRCHKLIDQKNNGLSSARNTGIENASGKYLMFLDGDDYIKESCISNILEHIDSFGDVDVHVYPYECFVNSSDVRSKEGVYRDIVPNIIYKSDVMEKIPSICAQVWPVWKHIVRREFLNSNKIIFAVGLYHEDLAWTSMVFSMANEFVYHDYVWYQYRMARPGAITEVIKYRNLHDILIIANHHHQLLSKGKLLNYSVANKFDECLSWSAFSALRCCTNKSEKCTSEVTVAINANIEVFKRSRVKTHRLFTYVFTKINKRFALAVYQFAIYLNYKRRLITTK